MQPQAPNQQAVPPSPEQFDFMMKDQPKPPSRLGSLLASVPKPAKVILLIIGAFFVIVILYSLLFGAKTTNSDQLVAAAARAQEIARVSTLAKTGSKNADTDALAATTAATASSQEQQIKSYLKTNKVSVSAKKLGVDLDKTTDTSLATALQNNNYDQTYFSYLKTSLVTYQNDLTAAYKGAGKNAQTLLNTSYASIQILLLAPQLK